MSQGIASGLVAQVRRRKPPATAPSDEWDGFVSFLESKRDVAVSRLRSHGVRNVEKAKLIADLKLLNIELIVALAHVGVDARLGR